MGKKQKEVFVKPFLVIKKTNGFIIFYPSLTKDYYEDYEENYYTCDSIDDKPSFIEYDYSNFFIRKLYKKFNQLHRITGPAYIGSDGILNYYLLGIRYFKENWNEERLKFL